MDSEAVRVRYGVRPERIADLVRERDLIVLSDEIYSRINYGEPPASIASLPGMLDKTIILDEFSKTYAMTGWRLGYGVMPEWLVEAVSKQARVLWAVGNQFYTEPQVRLAEALRRAFDVEGSGRGVAPGG